MNTSFVAVGVEEGDWSPDANAYRILWCPMRFSDLDIQGLDPACRLYGLAPIVAFNQEFAFACNCSLNLVELLIETIRR